MKIANTYLCSFLLFLLWASKVEAQWRFARGAGGTNNETGTSVATDALGNLYLGGTFSSASISFGSYTLMNDSTGTSDIFIVKYDSLGNVLWAKREGGKGDELLKAIKVTSTGNLSIAGTFMSPSIALDTFVYRSRYSCPRYFLAQYNPMGTLNWARSYDTSSNWPGCPEAYTGALSTDAHGNTYLSIYFVGDMIIGADTFSTNLYDRYESLIMKYDAAGHLLRTSQIHTEPYTYAVIGSIAADSVGNIFATGVTDGRSIYAYPASLLGSGAGGCHFLVKLDTAGNGRYIKKMYSSVCCEYDNYFVGIGAYNEVYVAGHFGDGVNSRFICGSLVLLNYAPGTSDIFLTRFDTACNLIWAKQAGGTAKDVLGGLAVSHIGTVYLAGTTYSDTARFGTRNIINTGTYNFFLTAYDTAGSAYFANTANGACISTSASVATSNSNAAYITGSYTSENIGFGAYRLNNTLNGTEDMFVAKYAGTAPNKVATIANRTSISAYPNPITAPGTLELLLPEDATNVSIALFNSIGQCVGRFQPESTHGRLQIHLPALVNGMYYLQIHTHQNVYNLSILIGQ